MPSRVQAPVFRLLFPFAAGIFLYTIFPAAVEFAGYGLIAVLLLTGITLALSLSWRWKLAELNGSLFLLILVLIGMLYTAFRDIRRHPHWIGHRQYANQHYLIEIRDEPKRTRSGWKIKADLLARNDLTKNHPLTGGLYLYTKENSFFHQSTPGRKAWIRIPLRPIVNKPNAPFDYAGYCLRQKITHEGFLSNPAQIRFLSTQEDPASLLPRVRYYIRTMLYSHLQDSLHAGLAAALFIGWKEGLDPELKQHYSRTGTIHIIAISGLHVSLVFEIVWYLLFPLIFIRGGRILRTSFTLIVVWVFCFLAGGEASVLRAGIMFTAVQLGRGLQRPVSGLQALGLSGLCLLLADPDWLFDPGCQLSHAAVAGILLLHPIFLSFAQIQNPILKNGWESACMTLAATIGTLPFSVYYFKQFPLLFLPANLIAVPLSSLILLSLFLLIPLAPLPVIGPLLAGWVDCLLTAMNGWIEGLDRIPGTVLSG